MRGEGDPRVNKHVHTHTNTLSALPDTGTESLLWNGNRHSQPNHMYNVMHFEVKREFKEGKEDYLKYSK